MHVCKYVSNTDMNEVIVFRLMPVWCHMKQCLFDLFKHTDGLWAEETQRSNKCAGKRSVSFICRSVQWLCICCTAHETQRTPSIVCLDYNLLSVNSSDKIIHNTTQSDQHRGWWKCTCVRHRQTREREVRSVSDRHWGLCVLLLPDAQRHMAAIICARNVHKGAVLLKSLQTDCCSATHVYSNICPHSNIDHRSNMSEQTNIREDVKADVCCLMHIMTSTHIMSI